MKLRIIVLFTLLSLSCSSSGVKNEEENLFNKITLAAKKDDIQSLSDIDYDQLTHYISEGKAYWVDLYPTLTKPPFLGITSLQEGLNISMAYALPENPLEVLKFLDESNIGAICGAPFIEPTSNEMMEYLSNANIALNKLPSGAYWKNRCILELNKTKSNDTTTVR